MTAPHCMLDVFVKIFPEATQVCVCMGGIGKIHITNAVWPSYNMMTTLEIQTTMHRFEISYIYTWIAFSLALHFKRLVQERRNSSVLAMELRLACTNALIKTIPCFEALLEYQEPGRHSICQCPSTMVLSRPSAGITLEWLFF